MASVRSRLCGLLYEPIILITANNCRCFRYFSSNRRISSRWFRDVGSTNRVRVKNFYISAYGEMLHHYVHGSMRCMATGLVHNQDQMSLAANPYKLMETELSTLCIEIKKELWTGTEELRKMTHYYFDGSGKAFRPMVVMLVAKACNFHHAKNDLLLPAQKKIAMIVEMIHTASLVHDDVIDAAEMRRGRPSIHHLWGQKKAILTGDHILSVATMALARLKNEQVVTILAQVIEDLIRGEFMQMGSKEDQNERFTHYLKKTFKKTASLIANSCKAVAVLGHCSQDVVEMAYQYGRHIGVAFQLVDDLLDFTSCDQILGKPTAADLRLGLATAPVLFAAQEYPELNPMIMRRFSQDGDVQLARSLVTQSDGVAQTRILAAQHGKEAVRIVRQLSETAVQQSLINIVQLVLERQK